MSVLNWSRLPVIEKPFAHVVRDEFLEPAVYKQAREAFPECPPSTGPTGYSLYWGDEAYEDLLARHECWRALFGAFHSQAFIDWAVDQFGAQWDAEHCRIDLAKARYVPYREDRVDKERATLRRIECEPHELWVRMDIYQGRLGYARAIHRDHARRLISMLVYLCDHDRHGLVGGEFRLHPTPLKRWIDPAVTVEPRENLMLAFPCSDRSYHSVPKITAIARPRNYLQIQISSSVDAWARRRL
jgi:hypothetical protein